jgi:hypothetical protein
MWKAKMRTHRIGIISSPAFSAIAGLLVLSLAACATQRYGRMTPVSPGERVNLTCEQVALEIEKAEFFLADIRRQRSQTSGAHVLGALGDFGIGNVMEGDAAEKSGMDRINQLKTMERDKGCGAAGTAAAPGSNRSSAPQESLTTANSDPQVSRETKECMRKRGTSMQSGPYSPWVNLPCG